MSKQGGCTVLCCRYLTGQEWRKCDDPGGHELRPCGQPEAAHKCRWCKGTGHPQQSVGKCAYCNGTGLALGHEYQSKVSCSNDPKQCPRCEQFGPCDDATDYTTCDCHTAKRHP